VATEPLHGPDVAIGPVQRPGDRLVTQRVRPRRPGQTRLAAEVADDQKDGRPLGGP
jgi:hypothetical protein